MALQTRIFFNPSAMDANFQPIEGKNLLVEVVYDDTDNNVTQIHMYCPPESGFPFQASLGKPDRTAMRSRVVTPGSDIRINVGKSQATRLDLVVHPIKPILYGLEGELQYPAPIIP